MSQDFGKDQNWSHPRPDRNEGSEQPLNRKEILQDAKTDPRMVSMTRRLQDRSEKTALLVPLWQPIRNVVAFTFGISGSELRGPGANPDVRDWSRILACLTLSTQGINFVTAWPFLVRSVGLLPGVGISSGVFVGANLAMKLACRRPRPGNHNSVNGLLWSGVLAVVSTIPAPLAQTLQNFAPDLANQHAHTVIEEYAFAEEQSALDAVMATEPQLREVEKKCKRLKEQIQANKEKNLPYDNLALEAEGKFIENYQSDDQWGDKPFENRPICAQSRGHERQFNADKKSATEALRLARSGIKTSYGDNHLEALKQEYPHLNEMYFDEAGRIRSSQQELAEAIRFMFTSNVGVKVLISVPTVLSILASLFLFLTTYFYISNPAVQRSWNSRAALNQRNRIRHTFDGGNGNGQ